MDYQNPRQFVCHTVLQYPFTCIVAGCAQSGKTVWVKKLLENAHLTIQPPPQRIVWSCGQWQPPYFEMLKSIPGIESYEAVPDEIEKSSF